MKKILINISNHPSAKWSEEQTKAASKIAKTTVDMPFPAINPRATTEQLQEKSREWLQLLTLQDDAAYHVMGEQGFCFLLIQGLWGRGAEVWHSTTERLETGFNFVAFRKY